MKGYWLNACLAASSGAGAAVLAIAVALSSAGCRRESQPAPAFPVSTTSPASSVLAVPRTPDAVSRSVPSAIPSPAANPRDGSTAHWKVERAYPFRPTETLEVWFNPGTLRVSANRGGRIQHTLLRDDRAYVWEEDEAAGITSSNYRAEPVDLAALRRFSNLGLVGEKVGEESLDDEECGVFEFQASSGRVIKVWISPRRDHALKQVFQNGDESVTISDIEVPAEIPASVFEPPGAVRFEEQPALRLGFSAADLGADLIILGRPEQAAPREAFQQAPR